MTILDARPQALTQRLTETIPKPHIELRFEDPWQLLVATILAAQSTDKMINTVTPKLFARWPRPADLATAAPEEVQQMIVSTGFFRNKTKSIQGAARHVVSEFGGQVPRTLKELITLPGVARKTANVVLGTAHGIPGGMAVDTHVGRLSRRLGFTEEKNPNKIEKVLCAMWPRERWTDMSHRLVLFGRHVCTAKRPACAQCPINELCAVSEADPEGAWEDRAERARRTIESWGAKPLCSD